MRLPNLIYENKLKRTGYKIIAGVDEAGRGPLAGPVVVGLVIFKIENKKSILNIFGPKIKIRDSKLLSVKQRERTFAAITKNFTWSVGVVENNLIDKKGINWAVSEALKKALGKIEDKPDFLLMDAGIKLPSLIDIHFQSVVRGDNKIFSCACASIVAKVWRDKIMKEHHQQFPQYNFAKHKGYGTKEHLEKIRAYGPSSLHRLSFRPLKNRKELTTPTPPLTLSSDRARRRG